MTAPQPIILMMFVVLGVVFGISIWPTHPLVAVLFGALLVGVGYIIQIWIDKRNERKN